MGAFDAEINSRNLRKTIVNRSKTIGSPLDGVAANGGTTGSAGNWSAAGNGTVSLATRDGVSVVRLSGVPAQAGNAISPTLRRAIPDISLTGKFEIHLFVPRPSVGSIAITTGFSATAAAADPPAATPAGYNNQYCNNFQHVQGAWSVITMNPPNPRYDGAGSRAWSAGNTTLPITLKYFDITANFTSDVPQADRFIDVRLVAINGKAKPMVMIGFDGFSSTVNTYALPLMKQAGIKGYQSGAGFNIAPNLTQLQELYVEGWDIISQAQRSGNPDYGVDTANLAADIDSARLQFEANGFYRARDCFTYMKNNRSPASDAILASKGYKLAGAFGQAITHQSQLGTSNLLTITRAQMLNATRMQALIDAAISEGGHLMFFDHNIVTTVTDSTVQIAISEFTTGLKYIIQKYENDEIDCVTPSQFLNALTLAA